jgi:hypothetical protein
MTCVISAAAPAGGPRISGLRGLYMVGDMVEANCTSSPSKPVTHITWYMNNKQVSCRKVSRQFMCPYRQPHRYSYGYYPIHYHCFIWLVMVCILSNHTTLKTSYSQHFQDTKFHGVAYNQYFGRCIGILAVSFSGSMLRFLIYVHSITSTLCILFYQDFNKSCLMPYIQHTSLHQTWKYFRAL